MHSVDSDGDSDLVALRARAAATLHRLGATEQALALLRAELAEAERFGSARAVGLALVALGSIEPRESGLAHLERAVVLLTESGSCADRARALTALGAALRRAGRRAEARTLLRQALETSLACGEADTIKEARAELAVLASRSCRADFASRSELTVSERRVCELAASGHSNPQIARSLFITRATVESHLHRAYQKLGVASRWDLAAALAA